MCKAKRVERQLGYGHSFLSLAIRGVTVFHERLGGLVSSSRPKVRFLVLFPSSSSLDNPNPLLLVPFHCPVGPRVYQMPDLVVKVLLLAHRSVHLAQSNSVLLFPLTPPLPHTRVASWALRNGIIYN